MLAMATRQKKLAQDKQVIAEALDTLSQSLVFVKRMVVIAVSSITYLRGIFPEDSYRSRYLEDLCIKVLKQDCSCPGARKLIKWLMGCFDALEKRYLQMVVIGVHTKPDDSHHVIESYQLKFRYLESGPQMDIVSNVNGDVRVTLEDTKKASTLLIRKLFLLMQNLEALPTAVYLTMKLYYNDDVTPPDYEPPGFKAGVNESLWFEGTAVHFRVGDLQSRFHSMKLRVTAAQSRLGKLLDAGQLSENDMEMETPSLSHIRPAETQVVRDRGQDLPSEDESVAQFKQAKKSIAKRKCVRSKVGKRKRKKCF